MFISIVQLNHFDKNISFPENDLSDETVFIPKQTSYIVGGLQASLCLQHTHN